MQNVSTGFRFVVPAVLSMVAQIAAADVSLTLGEQDFADASTPTYEVDVTRLRALGWEPRVGLRQGIADTYAWYLAQQRAART